MRTVFLMISMVTGFAALAAAGESEEIMEIVELVKGAFTSEGTFDTDAREKLLDANDLIVDFLDEGAYGDEEYIAAMSLQSLVKYNLACLDAIDGEIEGAFVWLDGAVNSGYTDAEWMAEDSDLEPLHGDSRFEELLENARELQEARDESWCPGGGGECISCTCESDSTCH